MVSFVRRTPNSLLNGVIKVSPHYKHKAYNKNGENSDCKSEAIKNPPFVYSFYSKQYINLKILIFSKSLALLSYSPAGGGRITKKINTNFPIYIQGPKQ